MKKLLYKKIAKERQLYSFILLNQLRICGFRRPKWDFLKRVLSKRLRLFSVAYNRSPSRFSKHLRRIICLLHAYLIEKYHKRVVINFIFLLKSLKEESYNNKKILIKVMPFIKKCLSYFLTTMSSSFKNKELRGPLRIKRYYRPFPIKKRLICRYKKKRIKGIRRPVTRLFVKVREREADPSRLPPYLISTRETIITRRIRVLNSASLFHSEFSKRRFSSKSMLSYKKKAFFFYGLTGTVEKFKKFFNSPNKCIIEPVIRLENCLSVFVWRLGLSLTVNEALTFVSFGAFYINDIKATDPFFLLKQGDTVTVSKEFTSVCVNRLRQRLSDVENMVFVSSDVVCCYDSLIFSLISSKISFSFGKPSHYFPSQLDINLVKSYFNKV